ncbi:MAG: hypothetical protein KDA91_12315, partial [Planctomycetaceae bacterium]|nr:hypothetical protein [Planctomycetaceae bacterium]
MTVRTFLRELTKLAGSRKQRRRTHAGLKRAPGSGPVIATQTLETRTLLSAVMWDGDGGDLQWTNPLNWSGDVLPGAADDVSIDVAGDITVEVTGNVFVNSLQSSESLNLYLTNLTVAAPSIISAATTITGGTTTAIGSDAVLNFSAGATINTTNLRATSGGELLFGPGTVFATNGGVHTTIEANGEGSLIDLSELAAFNGTSGTQGHTVFYTNVNAYGGGRVDLSGAVSVGNQTYIRASGQDSQGVASRVDLAAMTDLAGTGRGSVLWAADVGIIHAPIVNTIQTAGLIASAGATLDLSSATSYDGGLNAANILRADGESSVLDLSGLTSFAGVLGTQGHTTFYSTIEAINGGLVDLSSTVTISNQTWVSVSGADGMGVPSRLDLTGLTEIAGAGQGANFVASGPGQVDAPIVGTILKTGFQATNGAVLDMSSATVYDGGLGSTRNLRADGQGSVLDLSGLTSFVGAAGSQGHTVFFSIVEALGGGLVDLSNVQTSTLQVNYSSSGEDALGTDSLINLQSLTEVTGNSLNSMTTADVGRIDLSSLTILRGTSLYASAGSVLDVSGVAEYHGLTVNNSTILATGLNSLIDLSGLQVLEGNAGNQGHSVWYLTIQAMDSGNVELGVGANDVSQRVSIFAESGSVSAGQLNVLSGATFAAVGTLDADLVNGTNLRIGGSHGNLTGGLTLNGEFEQLPGGSLSLKIGGLTAGTQFDQFNVSGTMTLGGALNISLVNGFAPADGDAFEILTFGSRTGDFDAMNGLSLPGNQILYPTYSAGSLVLGAIGDDPPVIATLGASPDPILQSADLTLTAEGVSDPNLNVAAVRFYHDTDENGLLDTGIDQLFGMDTDGTDGWSITAPATFAAGTHTFLVQAEDTTDNFSNVVSAGVELIPSVYWDGDAGDFQWTNPLNWSGDTLPGANDDVVINVAGDITVTHSGTNTTIRSLTSSESLNLSGGSLSVTATSVVHGAFAGSNATLTVSGPSATFLGTGPTTLSVTSLIANNGGVIELPNATSYAAATDGDTNLLADGAGSKLQLTGITSLNGVGRNGRVAIKTTGGGVIDLSNLVTIPSGTTEVSAMDPGSLIDFSRLQTWTDANQNRSSSVTWGNGGVVNVDSLLTMNSIGVTANTGETLVFPALTHMGAGSDTTAVLIADGIGSRIEFPVLTTMDGTNRHGATHLRARNGGVIDMSAVVHNLDGTTLVSAFDAGSLIDLSSLQTWTDGNQFNHSSVTWGLGGFVAVDSLHTISSVGIVSNTGDTLVFPALTAMQGGGDTSALVLAEGSDSRIEFPVLTTMDGTNRHGATEIRARNGGVIDMSSVIDNVNGTTVISAFDAGSLIDLSSLQYWIDGNQFGSSSLTWGDGGTVNVDSLQTTVNVSLLASGGNVLTFPAMERIGGTTDSASVILADGAGSRLEFPSVTVADGTRRHGNVAFRARNGGVVNLPALLEITTGAVAVSAADSDGFGNGSIVSMPLLQSWTHGNLFQASSLTGERDGIVNVGTLAAQTDIQGVQIAARGTGRLASHRLHLLTSTTLSGDGVVGADVVNTSGRVQVGHTIGLLTIDGDFQNETAGIVAIDIGGTAPGTDSDRLLVTGTAILDGTLQVSIVNGFVPVNGDAFEILQFDSRVCDFLTKTGLDLGNGLYLAAAFDLDSMTLNAGSIPDSGQQCQTTPVFTNVDVGPNPAKAADAISITFEVDVPLLTTPTVVIDGHSAVLSAQNGSLYTFTYTVTGTETEGAVDVVITATSLDGGVGTTTVITTLDFTDPVVTNITPDHSPADVGTVLTVTFDSSETLSNSTIVRIGGQPATRNSLPGYSYSRLLTGDEGLGQVTVEVAAVDVAGNTSSATRQILVLSGGLDMDATGISLTDDHPGVGQTVTASATVHNSSLHDAINVPVRLTIVEPVTGERVLQTYTIPLITAGGTASVSADIDLATDGVHVFRVEIDPDNLIAEIIESDNVATRSILVDSAVHTVIDLAGSLSAGSAAPGTSLTLSGTASYFSSLNAAGPAAGATVSVSVSGTGLTQTGFTDSTGTFSLTFDSPVAPGDYVAQVTVSDVTTSTILALPFTVTAPSGGIDLVTNNGLVASSDATPIINGLVTLSARVYNVGSDDFTGTTSVDFYDGAILIGSQAIHNLTSQTFTDVAITHAFASPGVHTVSVRVDEADLVIENSETNNTGALSVTVLEAIPDLIAVDLQFSDETPATTDLVTLTAKVVNTGGSAATNVLVRFFDNGSPLGAVEVPSVAADGGVEFVSIQANPGTSGSRQISVVVDADNSIVESDETNNSWVETIEVHNPVAELQANLITLSSSTPLVNQLFDVSMSVSNTGEIAADHFDVQFLRDGVAFGTVHIATLAAGESTTVTLPASFNTVGPHSVSIVIDSGSAVTELLETNNQASKNLQVLATPLADLQISAEDFALSDSNPGAGDSVTVSVPVQNRGLASATGVTAELRIDGMVIGSAATTPTDLGAGQSGTWSFTFNAPVGDGFHLLEIVVDEGNLIGESEENNNRDFIQFLVGDHPDLVPSDITYSSDTPTEGDSVTIFATVHNDGDEASDAFTVRFLDGSQMIGQVTVPGLAVGTSQTVSVDFDTSGRAGLRDIQVIVDPGNLITEVNEGNNLINRGLIVAAADPIAPTTIATPSVAPNSAGWNRTDVEVVLTATDNTGGSGVSGLMYSIDGGPVQITFSNTQTILLSNEGIHTITYQAVDLAQNIEALQILTVRIDKTAPTAIHSGPFTVEEGNIVQLGGDASTDGLSGVANNGWDINANGVYDATAYLGSTAPFQQDVALRVVDEAGNETIVVTQVTVTNSGPVTVEPGDRGQLITGGAGTGNLVQIVVSLEEATNSAVEAEFLAYQTHLDNGLSDSTFVFSTLGFSLTGFEQFERLLEYGTFRGAYQNVIVGSNYSENLTGTSDSDLIVGNGGNDTIIGLSGNDIIIGSTGNDVLDGGDGDDAFLYSGAANGFDSIEGGAGIDRAIGVNTGTIIGVNGYDNGVEEFIGLGDTIIRDTNYSRTLDFTNTILTGIAEVDAAGGNDTVNASNLSDGVYRGGTGDDVLAAGDMAVTWLYSGTNQGFDSFDNGTGLSIAVA